VSIKIENLHSQSEPFKKDNSKEKPRSFNFDSFFSGSSKINKKRNTLFFQELAILLSSGIDIRSSLDIILSESSKEKDIVVIRIIRECIIEGKSLSEALKISQAFTSFDYYNILIGEETGNLVATLELLYEYHARRQENGQKIQSAIAYPLIVLSVSVVAVIIMLKFIVPVFADVYARFGHELPVLTQFILKLSENLGKYLTITIILILFLFFLKRQIFKNNTSKSRIQNLIIRLPIMGKYILNVHLEKFFHSFTILLNSKINLVQSLEILRKMTNFLPLSHAIEQIEKDIIYGISLSEAMKKHKNVFDIKHVTIIKVGEEVNKLDFVIQKVKEQLDKRIQATTGFLTTALEPFLILFVGLIVGVVLIAMYLPMFKLSGTFL